MTTIDIGPARSDAATRAREPHAQGRIAMLSAAHPALDKRVFTKEAVSLAAAGYAVTHFAPDVEPRSWMQEGVQLVTYPAGPGGWRGRLGRLGRLYRLAAAAGADAWHCNEVDSWVIGLLLKRRHGGVVVFDVHEHYPYYFEATRIPRIVQRVLASLIRLTFRLLSPPTDRLVLAKRFLDPDFPGTTPKQVLVENFGQLAFLEAPSPADAAPASDTDPFVVVHSGNMAVYRGWPQLLDAIAAPGAEQLHLHLVGTFADGSRPAFDRRVAELGLGDRVRVEEWLPFAEAQARVRAADVGVVLFRGGIMNHVYALPHKMFDYMLAGLPVLAPHFALEVAAIVQESDCGHLVEPEDPASIRAALLALVADRADARRLGANGQRAVLERYNWEAEAAKLIRMYNDLLAAAPRGRAITED